MLRRLLRNSAASPEVGVLFTPEAAILIPYPHPVVASKRAHRALGAGA